MDKVSELKENILNLDTLMTLLEVLQQLDNVDLLGNSVPMKLKLIDKIDKLIDKI